MTICSVYWVHLPEHTDITCEGYVGVTGKTVADRFSQHKFDSRSEKAHIFAHAIRKYGDALIVEKVLIASEEYCYMIEQKLRPNERIGWNTVVGGGKPPVFNRPHTDEAKRKISEASRKSAQAPSPRRLAATEAQRGVKRSAETRKLMSESQLGRPSWEASRTDKDVWSVSDKIYQASCDNPCMGYINLEKLFGYKKYKLHALYKKFKKQNWNPSEDPEWLQWKTEYIKGTLS